MVESYKKNRAQMETRKFKLAYPVENVQEYLACENKSEIDHFIQKCNKLGHADRYYKKVTGSSSVDSAFVLEAMGLGMYSYRYQIIFDFSDKLDYLMHNLTGCQSAAVRQLPGYHDLSYAILNNDYSRLATINFQDLFKVDKQIMMYFERLSFETRELGIIENTARMKEIVYRFFNDLMTTLTNIRDYAMSRLNSEYRTYGFVYRSKNLSSAVISSGIDFREDVILRMKNLEDCLITPRCYERYEYASREVFVCANCRKCKRWC